MKLSIRLMMFLAIFAAAVTTALVGFIPTYQTGRQGIDDAVAILRLQVINRIDASLRLFFAPSSLITGVTVQQGLAGLDIVDTLGGNRVKDFGQTKRDLYRHLCGILIESNGTIPSVSAFYNGAPDFIDPNHRGYYQVCDNRFGFYQVCGNDPVTTNVTCFFWNETARDFQGGEPSNDTVSLRFNIDIKTNEDVTKQILGADVYTDPNYRWGPVAADYDTIRFSALSSFRDVRGNTSTLIMSILPTKLSERVFPFLGLTPGSRVMFLDAVTARVFGLSWNELPADRIDGNWTNLNLPDTQRYVFKTAADVQDPLILKVTAALGGPRSYFSLPSSYSTTLFEGRDRVFLDVKQFDDPYGLNVRMVVVMPEEDFVGETNSQLTLTIIGLVCAVVAMVTMAVIFSILLTKPLGTLAERMERTARLEDEDDVPDQSVLSEIAALQNAYVAMKSELTRMKAFLPQSLLAGPAGDSDNEIPVDATNPLSASANSNKDRLVAVDTERLASSKPNRLSRKDCTVVLISLGFRVAAGSEEYGQLLDKVMVAVVSHASKQRGVVETMRPDQVVVSFGARRLLGNSPHYALRFAEGVSQAINSIHGVRGWVLLDRGSFFVGACGTEKLRHEVLSSSDFSVLQSLGPVLWRLRAPIAATGRISPSLTEGCTTIPIECVEWSASNRVHLFQVVLGSRTFHDDGLTMLRRGFALMCAGGYAEAAKVLRAASQQASVISPSAEMAMESEGDPELREAAGRLCAIAYALADSKAPYAKRYLGWAAPEMFVSPEETRAPDLSAASTQKDDRLSEQLMELQRIKTSNKEPAVFKDSNRSKQSNGDNATATAALFEMAFTATVSVHEQDPDAKAALMSLGSRSSQGVSSASTNSMFPLVSWRRGKTVLGEGSFGKVYKALHENGSMAAMKVIPLASYRTNIDDVQKELIVASEQQHDNVVNFFQSGIEESQMVVVMEFMAGGSLSAVLEEFGALGDKLARRVLTDVARGLAHLHHNGIIHCDVKPQNVLLGLDGICKLADFGSALHPDLTSATHEDEMEVARGTPAYMAPEVAGGGTPTMASDVWSFGVLTHELATGRLPFNAAQLNEAKRGAASCMRLLAKLGKKTANGGDPDDAASVTAPLRASLPGDYPSGSILAELVNKCLAVDPAKRPTCEELLSTEFFF